MATTPEALQEIVRLHEEAMRETRKDVLVRVLADIESVESAREIHHIIKMRIADEEYPS